MAPDTAPRTQRKATAAVLSSSTRALEQRSPARIDRPDARLLGVPLPHVHRFRYAGDDAFSAHSLYRCRCGVVKHGL